ncbi:MAG TPA: cellulase family glycosylhydrolase [Solirubrobacteraceae bacterium]|jgi:hypothetical protein
MPARHIAICALLAAACLGASTPAAVAAPQLQVVGNHLVDATTGQTFVPRGAAWPSFEYACIYGYGYSDEADPAALHPDAAAAALITSWHVNTVRVGLNQDCWLGDDGMPAFGTVAGYRAAVQQWVSLLHAAGLPVILDLHWSAPTGVVAEGQRAAPDDRSDDFWTSVATTFKDDPSVMFEAFNEPYSRTEDSGAVIFDLTWTCWLRGGCNAPQVNDAQPFDGKRYVTLGMQQLVDAIRATGATQPILLAGRDYANDLAGWLENRPADGQLVAAFHNYASQACNTRACWDSTIAPIAAQVPVVITEFGQTDCADSHVKNVMDWSDPHGVGYVMWAFWVLPEPDCAKLAMLADVNGTPRAPNGTAFKAHMDALAAAPGGPPSPVTPGSPATPATPAGAAPTNPTAPTQTSGPSARLVLGGRTRQRLGGAVTVTVACGAPCAVRARGGLVVTARVKHRPTPTRRRFALRPAAAGLAGGGTTTLALRLPGKARRAARSALRHRGSAAATITVTATGAGAQQRRVKLGL